MDIVGQIVSALKLGTRAAFTVFCACALCLAADHYRQDLFDDLPVWVIPVLRLGLIFSFALWFVPVVAALGAKLQRRVHEISSSFASRRRYGKLQRVILASPLSVKYALLYALFHQTQYVEAVRSNATTIAMLDSGLLKPRPWGERNDFIIPDDAWRAALGIDGFVAINGRSMSKPWFSNMTRAQTMSHVPEKFRKH